MNKLKLKQYVNSGTTQTPNKQMNKTVCQQLGMIPRMAATGVPQSDPLVVRQLSELWIKVHLKCEVGATMVPFKSLGPIETA